MLRQHLIGAGVSTCLTNNRLLEHLRFVLLRRTDIADTSHEDFYGRCQLILREELDREEPRRFRTTDIEQVVRTLWPTTMFLGEAGAVIPFLDALAAQLFDQTDTVVHFRDDAIDEYTRFSARIDPTLVLCWKVVREAIASNMDGPAVEALVAAVQPFCTRSPDTRFDYADNHVHLGGASCEQLILITALRGGLEGAQAAPPMVAKELGQVRQLAHGLLSREDELGEDDVGDLAKRCLSLFRYMEAPREVNWPLLKEQTEKAAFPEAAWFKHRLASCLCAQDLSRAWLWFLLWCFWQYQDKSAGPMRRIAIFVLIGSVMRVRQGLLVDGYGLARFIETSGKRRSPGLTPLLRKDAVQRIFRGTHDVAELKVAAGQIKETFVRNLLDLLLAPLELKSASAADVERACSRWHFCVYFSRGYSKKATWEEADDIAKILRSQNRWTIASPDHLPGVKAHSVQPSRLIRALDVAGDENISKIEVFAPALRWLRSVASGNEHKLFLSIHAGEDYAHPLSGMRHIDETVEFCKMGYGDRIGHGLALGITPEEWFRERGQAVLTAAEYLDNLVWTWHYATECPALPGAAEVAAACAAAVQELAAHIPWFDDGKPIIYSMHDLRDAWRLRENCPKLALDKTRTDMDKVRAAVPDLASFDTDHTAAVRLFATRHKWSAQKLLKRDFESEKASSDYLVQITCSERNGGPQLRRHDNLRLFAAVESPTSLRFMEALQDMMIEKCRKRGLVFEVNPTSNHHIGSLSELRNHPIFRWNPPDRRLLSPGKNLNRFRLRKGPLQVCINTDDPGIMPTTLRTEFELLRNAALDHGVTLQDASCWLNGLRRKGVRLFQAAHPVTKPASNPHWMDVS